MNTKNQATLGSLFDGIGGFPYAGLFYGIQPLWASEILPQAVSVTKRHLPRMEHVGDITQLDGAKLPPVDVITFGSPCQGLSHAGKRQGFADERSALFAEAIRIIDEMRKATDGKYPRFALWENVPGALSSGTPRGSDFQSVLEAFTKTEVPVPQSGRWANAGMVRGHGVDLAWRVLDAQHFGVPQRRRRIFLVADFGSGRAGEILFVEESLRGHIAPGGETRQTTAADAQRGIGDADASIAFACNQRDEVRDLHDVSAALCAQPSMKQQTFIAKNAHCLTPWDIQQSRVFAEDGTSPTLAGADGGGGRNPAGLVFTAGFCAGAGAKAKGIGYKEECAPTMKGGGGGFQMPTVFCAASSQAHAGITEELAGTLTCQHEQPFICEPETARTLTARGDGSPCADRGPNVVAVGVHQNQDGNLTTADTAYSLAASGNASSRNAPLVAYNYDPRQSLPAMSEVHPPVSGTLCASGAGLSRTAGMASETNLCVAYATSPLPIPIHDKATRHKGGGPTRNGDGAGNGLGVGKPGDPAPTMTAGDHHAVAAVDCRNYKEVGDISGTLQAKDKPGYSLNYQNPVRTGYIVRRLTPTECERLQGYPDGWTAVGHDDKAISDTRRYQMLGNSIAVPCVAFILRGIARQLVKSRTARKEAA